MTTLSDAVRYAIISHLNNVHTALPAKIISYDSSKKKAKVQPTLNKRYANGQNIEMPIINGVPVVFPSSSNFSMTWPLSANDYVLLVFSERSTAEWLNKGGLVTPQDPRKFDLSDAIAIPGLMPYIESNTNSNNDFTVKIGDATFKMSPDGKFCFSGQNEELMSILDELFTTIEAITVSADQGGVPNPIIPINNITDFQALQVRFNQLKGDC